METSTKTYWYGGVENLVQNEEGYVFWKGEMMDLQDVLEDAEAERAIAEKLGAICKMLESVGTAVNVGNVYLFMD